MAIKMENNTIMESHDAAIESNASADKCRLLNRSSLRGVTRLYAVQTLYKFEKTSIDLMELLEESKNGGHVFITAEDSHSKVDIDFFCKLIKIIHVHAQAIDETISQNLTSDWKIGRLDIVLKSIIRLGVAEMLFMPDVPQNVIFNEYIEIGKAFFEKADVSFINGILNKVAKIVRVQNPEALPAIPTIGISDAES